jgi:hypothetical protein
MSPIQISRHLEGNGRKGIRDNLLAATMTIFEAGTGEINDSRHKLASWSVVRAHKQIRVS